MEQSKYCAFISYRHLSPDQEIAKALHTAIETYHIPSNIQKKTGKKRMGRVFRDQEELPLSADLGADIETALDSSDWLIVVCSPRYQQSRWCMRELEYFVEHKGRERVIAILAEGEPGETFPDEIRYSVDSEGNRIEIDPHAADVRGADLKESFKKLKNEKLRLLAPMLSVTYDELKRRERQRRRKKLLISAAAVFVAAVGLGTFLTVSHIRNEALKREAAAQQAIAEEQARLAEEQAKLAEERKKLAEEQRIRAVSNEIGELLERSESEFAKDDRIASAQVLLEALELSDANDGMRHEEIIPKLRRTMMLTPFSTITAFDNQNARILDTVPSSDGRRMLGVMNWDHVAMIDFVQNEIVYQVSTGNSMIIYLEFSPDESRFLANYGTHATVWNTEDGSEVFTYRGKYDTDHEIINIFFWRDSDTLLVQERDQFLFVSIKDGSSRLFYTYGEQQDWYSPDNNLYTYLTGHTLTELITMHTAADDYTGVKVIPAKDWSKILIGGRGGETGTLLIDENGQLVCPMTYLPATVFEKNALSPDGKIAIWLSTVGVAGIAIIAGCDTESGELLYLNPFPEAEYYVASEIAFSPDSSRLAVFINNALYIIDARTGVAYLNANIDASEFTPTASFSDDGKYLYLTNNNLYIVDAETFGLLKFESGTDSVAINNAKALKHMLFTSDNNGAVRMLCLPELTSITEESEVPGELIPRYFPGDAPEGAVEPILEHVIIHGYWEQHNDLPEEYLQPLKRYSREGDRMAVIYPDGAIELFDTFGDGHVKSCLQQLTMPITAFGIVNNRLIASDYSGRIMFYDLEQDKIVSILNDGMAHTGFAYTENGDYLMALRIGTIPAIDVYSLEDGALLFTMNGSSSFTDFAFTTDGQYAVGIMENGGFIVADMLTDETVLLEKARAFVAENR